MLCDKRNVMRELITKIMVSKKNTPVPEKILGSICKQLAVLAIRKRVMIRRSSPGESWKRSAKGILDVPRNCHQRRSGASSALITQIPAAR